MNSKGGGKVLFIFKGEGWASRNGVEKLHLVVSSQGTSSGLLRGERGGTFLKAWRRQRATGVGGGEVMA